MTTAKQASDPTQWDATNPANKDLLLKVIRDEAERMFELASVPENWEGPTASGHWQVQDIIGHMLDVTEGYLGAFNIARSGGQAPEPFGLRVMSQRLDEHALAFRSLSQNEALKRLRDDFEEMMSVFAALSADEWTSFLVSHPYMGPVPAFIYPVFHLVDYGVHGWDIREGLQMPNGLTGDCADFLVPIMFVLWQSTVDTERLSAEPIKVGVRVSGRNGGDWRVGVTKDGYTYERLPAGEVPEPTVLEFDPASLVLTAYGRVSGGTTYGDRVLADKYRSLFFAI